MKALSVTLAATGMFACSALAETSGTMLDIPSGYQNDITWRGAGLNGIPFVIASENFAFKQNDFATQGVVRAWDYEENANAKAKLWLTAAEGFSLTSLSFDISGFKDFESTARLKVYVDGVLFKDKAWSFDGNSTLMHRVWDFGIEASEVRITLENLNGSPYTGLDNINIGTVPAPGAVALLGLAGIAGIRRRRG